MLYLVASDGLRTVPHMSAEPIHPWRRLRALGDTWRLKWHHGGAMGETDHAAQTISLRVDLTWAERRCTVLHETLHAERGPANDETFLAEREELRVRKETARLLLPSVRPIGEALAWSGCRVAEAADELCVDVGTLWDRLDHLHPAERGYLRRRLEDVA